MMLLVETREAARLVPAMAELAFEACLTWDLSSKQTEDFSLVPPTQEYPSITEKQSVVHSRFYPGSHSSSPVITPSPHVGIQSNVSQTGVYTHTDLVVLAP